MSEWRMVINPHGMGYSEGLDPRRELEFKRVGDDTVSRFRLADANPYFNIAGLMWREPPAQRRPQDWAAIKAYRP
jgi:hypothetical protein